MACDDNLAPTADSAAEPQRDTTREQIAIEPTKEQAKDTEPNASEPAASELAPDAVQRPETGQEPQKDTTPNTWHAAECAQGGRMLTIFKDGRFDEYLKKLDTMTSEQFADAELMKSLAEEYDIFES